MYRSGMFQSFFWGKKKSQFLEIGSNMKTEVSHVKPKISFKPGDSNNRDGDGFTINSSHSHLPILCTYFMATIIWIVTIASPGLHFTNPKCAMGWWWYCHLHSTCALSSPFYHGNLTIRQEILKQKKTLLGHFRGCHQNPHITGVFLHAISKTQ